MTPMIRFPRSKFGSAAALSVLSVLSVLSLLSLLSALSGCASDGQDDVVKACIKSTACNVKAYASVSTCVDGYHNLLVSSGQAPVYNALYACVVAAADCAGVKACWGVGGSCDNSYKASCAGGTAQFCDLLDHTTFSLDCAGNGLSCEIMPVGSYSFDATCKGSGGEGQAGEVDCGDGSCTRTGQGCTSGNDFDRCAGDRLEACLGNEWVSFDCAKLGLGACLQAASSGACAGY